MDPHPAACMVLPVPETPPLRMHNPPPDPPPLVPSGRAILAGSLGTFDPRFPPEGLSVLRGRAAARGHGALCSPLPAPSPAWGPGGVGSGLGPGWGGTELDIRGALEDSSPPGRRRPVGDPQADC